MYIKTNFSYTYTYTYIYVYEKTNLYTIVWSN